MAIYFTSDLHFGHANAIKYDKRPFNNVEEMDEEIIRRWNNRVTDDDTVYILGDISWWGVNKTEEIFKRLNGHKILIKGNHDSNKNIPWRELDAVCDYREITVNTKNGSEFVILSHYPIAFYNRQHRGSYMFYGHVHVTDEWELTKNIDKMMKDRGTDHGEKYGGMHNVGCMIWDYEPKTFEEIVGMAEDK